MTKKMEMHNKTMIKIEEMEITLAHSHTKDELEFNNARVQGAVDLAHCLNIIDEEERDHVYKIIEWVYETRGEQL